IPIPAGPNDPRRQAIAAVVGELERLGIATGYQTILVACGLARRSSQRELETLVPPELARRFHGRVVVHDAEDPELVVIGEHEGIPLRVNPALVETELAVLVTAAETVVHGGPAVLLAATGAESQRATAGGSLLVTAGSPAWARARAVEREVARRVPLIGVSLVLNHPQLSGWARGYPYEADALERIARSPFRHAYAALPAGVRQQVLRGLPVDLTAAGAYGGPPSVAHAEALLRAVELRRADLDRPLDALVIGIPRATPYLPRERPNPLLAAFLGLGFAMRLWRDASPVVEGGTAILLHRFHRHFEAPTQVPYRTFFQLARNGLAGDAEAAAVADERAIQHYRAGRSCHPLLPFRDWDVCSASAARLGSVLIGGCRDATAARQLGFVPVHGVAPALEIARGRGAERIGFLLSPPYFPIRVGS
ncbi:MAG TPA: lactate racemase domain-containing protein, partial [Candidatus Binatia bacterium]|nr:lactate racemase domain-containing protein [Candidatus Binatia bacterium]